MFSFLALGALLSFLNPNAAGTSPRYCKPIPGSPGWPSTADWQALNRTVDGRLLTASTPGAVCHPSSASYDNVSCASTRFDWTSSSWHAEDPVSSDYNDDTCLPDARAPCSLMGYPAFIINATGAADVRAGVQFAAETGVRLIIKGTGHDFPGRSSGPHSLSIWTHHIRGITIDKRDYCAIKAGGVASVRIGAGMRMGEIYPEMAKHDLTFVGGADPGVGVGGWYGGGGHSPVSSVYGMGADQVLGMEVVTADGQHRIVNATSNPDLFWALRGVSFQTDNPDSILIDATGRTLYIRNYGLGHCEGLPAPADHRIPVLVQHNCRHRHILDHDCILPLADPTTLPKRCDGILLRRQ